MSDNLRKYRAIRDALIQGVSGPTDWPGCSRMTTLAAMISGIVGSKRTQLPHIATKVPDGTGREPGQTLCLLGAQRQDHQGDVRAVCAGVAGPSGLANSCAHH